jgi:shikimate kinase
MARHLILIGLPGAGKTTVAREAAMLLHAPWTDLDAAIAQEAGCSIPELFVREGEASFRARERAAMTRALAEPPQIIAAGGGWAAQPGNLDEAELLALVVLLEVSPAVAARRVGAALDRPLLVGDPLPKLEALAAERAPFHARAGFAIAAEAAPELVAAALATGARQYAGW